MAMTHDYLEFLDERIGISPANSEEELQAAGVISDLMAQHDVRPVTEDFEAPALSGLFGAILATASLVGAVVSGVGVLPLILIGLVLAALPAGLSVARVFGHSPRLTLGPRAQSQNVIAVHRATGPLVTKGSRTIVIAAHYDSPRENLLYTSPLAPYLTLLSRVTVPCSFVTAVCALAQLLGFLPAPLRIVMWLIGIVAVAPAMALTVGVISERAAGCTDGANDNKAAVAALLGVLENVRPSGVEPKARPVAEPAAAQPEVVVEGTEPAAEPEPVLGVRHGEEVLRSLAILPEGCEIEYVSASAPASETAQIEPVAPEPEAARTAEVAPVAAPEPIPAAEPAPVAEFVPEQPAAPAAEAEAEVTAEVLTMSVPEPAGDADVTAETTREDLLETGRFAIVMDDGSTGVGPKDSSGLSTMSPEFDADATQSAPERPEAPSDPEWGKTSYRPQLSSVARRASLFDLPDPSANEVDPFATDPNATRMQPPTAPAPVVVPTGAEAQDAPQADPIETIGGERAARPRGEKRKGFVSSLLGRLRGKSSDDDGAAADASDDGRTWRGGAATRGGLRLVEGEGEAPAEEELRDAALRLGDDALIAHDIWFVALGGSSLDHAGMRDFLARHRSEVRGCFVVNLDCVGAGRLVTLKNEGLEETRRADRRMTRLLAGAAADLHIELGQEPHDWADTDATPAMRRSLRSVTLMGLDDNGLPALSRTPDDVLENVDGDQAAQVAALVTEMIRRS